MQSFKYLVVSTGFLAMAACSRDSMDNVKLETDVQKFSYMVGQQIGAGLKNQEFEVDTKTLAASIQHVLDGKTSLLSEQEMQEVMQKTQMAMMEKAQKRAEDDAKKSEENKKTGADFLAANKSKEGIKTTTSGLQYKIVTEGKGKKPTANDTVRVHYKGTLIDGTEFDSSYKRDEPAEFPVTRVIPGWTEALQMMPVGSKWQLFIPAELAYGQNPRPNIPGNSVLIFDVELLDIVQSASSGAPAAKPPTKKQ